mgnify:CR=1 FL=1
MPTNTFTSDAEKIQTLADFSKAVYAVQSWELKAINDPNTDAQETYQSLLTGGWKPLDLNIATTSGTYKSSSTTFKTTNKMDDGFYTYANAAALVATSGNSLVLSFRGTNDYSEKGASNPLDPLDNYYPDYDHWKPIDFISTDSMSKHYQYFSSLFSSLNGYLLNHSDIENVYVTGHSMGGAMALEYMSSNPGSYYDSYDLEAITFAASPFVSSRSWLFGTASRKDYSDDNRITQIEIAQDPIEESWEALVDSNRPGKVVRLSGDQTLDTPDSSFLIYNFRQDNHSMSYYQEMAYGIDQSAWSQIVGSSSLNQVVDVYLAGDQSDDEFIVSGSDDTLNGKDFDLVFGGEGNDIIYANSNSKANGGSGVDTLVFSSNKSEYSLYLNDTSNESSAYSSSSYIIFNNFERLKFQDMNIALDLDGNAGDVVKIIGAMFGSVAANNKYIVGEWLREIDAGIGYKGLVDKALNILIYSPDDVFVRTIYHNVTNEFASDHAVNHYVSLLDSGSTREELADIAIDYHGNLSNIDIVGLSETGIEYV